MGVGRGRIGVGLRVRAPIFHLLFYPHPHTKGDKWAYTFDVVHDIPGLIEKRGGVDAFIKSLDDHFDGGHNDHTNEVRSLDYSFLFSFLGALTLRTLPLF